MFDTTAMLFIGFLLLVIGVGLAGIFACRPTSRVVLRKDRESRSTPEEMLPREIARLRQAVGERDGEDRLPENSPPAMRMGLYRESYASLARMAPRAAIVKVWRELESNVRRAASEELIEPPATECVNVSDAWALLRYCHVIDETDVVLLEGLERARNLAASMAPCSVEPDDATAFVEITASLLESMNALNSLEPAAVKALQRRMEREAGPRAFSVMPLTKNQRIVESDHAGNVILTPEVLKRQQARRRA